MKRLSVIIMVMLIAQFAYAKGKEAAPPWIDEAWRDANYPSGVWYVGFAQNTLPPKSNTAEYLKTLERDALNKMVEGISVRISGTSTVENTSLRIWQDGNTQSASSTDYRQIIQASASAEIAKSEVRSYHNQKAGKIYALAVVRKSDLASYYVSRVDYHIHRAESTVKEAQQLTELDKNSDALKKYAESRKNLDECVQYLKLLSAIDYESSESQRLLARETALRQEISAAAAEAAEPKSFYVSGTETMGGKDADIVISKLKSIISKNGYRLADDPNSAGYNVSVEVKDCNVRTVGNFTFCYACIRVEAVNVKTGKNEGLVDFTGPKTSWKDRETACLKAFEKATDEVWVKIKEDIKIFK